MSFFETFSKRKKKVESAGQVSIYKYDNIPVELRKQVIHIWNTAIGAFEPLREYGQSPVSNEYWKLVHDMLARELGVFNLGSGGNPFEKCQEFILKASADNALDIIEVTFRLIERVMPDLEKHLRDRANITQDPKDAIEELNHRFFEHECGYQFVSGEIVRVDSQFIHANVVKPAITLLHEGGFDGAAEEFMKAYDHYNKGNTKEAINEGLKSFESTMKAICDSRQWPYDKNATAKPLIDLLAANGLFPQELMGQLSGLRAALESGVPTIRNKVSGHGQGATPKIVQDHTAAFVLHLTASNIVFLVQSHKHLA